MQQELLGIKDLDAYLVVGILFFFGLLEIFAGHLKGSRRTADDWIQELGGFVLLSLLIKPLMVLSVLWLGNAFWPVYGRLFLDWSLWGLVPFYLLVDDFLQYWYHRFAHQHPFFWKLHRPHHQAEEMGFFVSYRNASLYYWLMPNIWWMGLLSFLGGGKAVAIGLVIKQLVIVSSHSRVKWDLLFYNNYFLRPFITVLERIIITPAFHHAHHGKSKLDGVSDPNGNFGNMFSLWDQLFGTALFTRKFPSAYGLPNNPKEAWPIAYFYPLIKSSDSQSELSKSYKKATTASLQPIAIELKKGQHYLWCQCGKSRQQPFCDGAHHGTKFKPLVFENQTDGIVSLCNCKQTKNSPFCDGSHSNLSQ